MYNMWFKALFLFAVVIYLTQAVPISSFVHSEKCLEDGVIKSGMNRDIFFKDDYDCTPQEINDERKIVWQTYLWCVGDFKNGTCVLDDEYIGKTASPVEFAAVTDCKNQITTDDTGVCLFQFINCFFPKVGNC